MAIFHSANRAGCMWIGVAVIVLTSCTTPSGYTNYKPYKPRKRDGVERKMKTGFYHNGGKIRRRFFSNF